MKRWREGNLNIRIQRKPYSNIPSITVVFVLYGLFDDTFSTAWYKIRGFIAVRILVMDLWIATPYSSMICRTLLPVCVGMDNYADLSHFATPDPTHFNPEDAASRFLWNHGTQYSLCWCHNPESHSAKCKDIEASDWLKAPSKHLSGGTQQNQRKV
jgi:hypothetical protein